MKKPQVTALPVRDIVGVRLRGLGRTASVPKRRQIELGESQGECGEGCDCGGRFDGRQWSSR